MRRQMVLSTLVLALIGAASVTGTPQPLPISEDLQHGQPITIQGSGFGSKAQAAPHQWDDFEDGTPGAHIPNYHNGWYVTPPGQNTECTIGAEWSDDIQRVPNGISVKQGHTGDFSGCWSATPEFAKKGIPGGDGAMVYVSAWFYATSTGPPRSGKFVNFNEGNWLKPKIRSGLSVPNSRTSKVSCDETSTILDYFTDPLNSGWHHWEFYYQISSNGAFKMWRDGQEEADVSVDYSDMLSCDELSAIYFMSYWSADSSEGLHSFISYWDEIYIDTTQARVMIGNNPNFSSCTHTEIQIPTEWSPNQISFVVNSGSFDDGTTAYLFVIDQNGVVNQNGQPVNLGGGGGGGVDNPPGNQINTPVPGGGDYLIPDSVSTLVITGTANDDRGIAEISWSNDLTSESGQVSNLSGDWRNWELRGISLGTGVNTIEIRVRDSANQITAQAITVTRDWEYPAKPEPPRIP